MDFLQELNMEEILVNPTLGIIPALLFMGFLLKHSTNLPNKYIPPILAGAGIVLGLIFVEFSASGVLSGLLYSAIAIFGHGLAKSVKPEKKAE